jgi:hypothetical protein
MPEQPEHGHVQSHPVPGHPSYEKLDVRFWPIIKFAVGLVVIALVIHLIILGVYLFLIHRAQKAQPVLSALEERDRLRLPSKLGMIPEPRLQYSDVSDFAEWKKGQLTTLDSFGWVNKEKGIVHTPIEQAMKSYAKQQQAASGKAQ